MSLVTGTIHTTQTYQAALLTENSNWKWVFFLMPTLIGCLLLMSLYTFFQYILNRDKAFLFYALYTALAFCWMMEMANPRFHLGFNPSFMPWLGLMHKKEGGSVYVKIAQLKEEGLQITITDDGIGRARAAGLKSKSAIACKSFGMKVTGERIALINHLYKTNAKVQVNDLTDAEGNAAGTEVVIEILI